MANSLLHNPLALDTTLASFRAARTAIAGLKHVRLAGGDSTIVITDTVTGHTLWSSRLLTADTIGTLPIDWVHMTLLNDATITITNALCLVYLEG